MIILKKVEYGLEDGKKNTLSAFEDAKDSL